MWIPAHTTVPPGSTAASAAGTCSPTGANRSAASSGSGAGPDASPAHSAPSPAASACASTSPARVNANTRRPSQTATWHTMWAAAPNPYRPSRSASPAIRSARWPISPAHSSGAACTAG